MEREPNRLTDGWTDLAGGIDSGRSPNIIPRNSGAFAINATMRGDFIRTRPKIVKRPLTFEDEDTQSNFEDGKMQGVGFYDSVDPLQVPSVGGHLFAIDRFFNVRQLTSTDRNNANVERAYFQQAERYLIIQDGESRPWIFNGALLRRSRAENYEVPVGTAMAYGHGRLAVASRREIHLGDISGGDTEVYEFKEETVIDAGGTFSVPFPGNITALEFIPILNTSTGQGPLTAHTPFGIATYNVAVPRSLWKTTPNFQTIAYRPFGAVSADSVVLVNSDAWFRSRDGFRSLQVILINNESSTLNSPQSREMNRVLEHDNDAYIDFCQGMVFDNRLLMTVMPLTTEGRVYFKGLAVLDFDPLSSLRDKTRPHYDGLWTGLNITRFLFANIDGIDRAFFYALDADGKNCLYELTKEFGDDSGIKRIECSFESAGYFGQNPREEKKLDACEFHADELSGFVDFNLQYRPDQFPCWLDYKTWSICAKTKDCAPLNGCISGQSLRKQYRPRMFVGVPPQRCLAGTQTPASIGRQFQIRLSWTGQARIKMGFLHFLRVQENPYGECLSQTDDCPAIDCCLPNSYSYTIE